MKYLHHTGYTGELRDANGLIDLRSRNYDPVQGRFLIRDTWGGSNMQPMSYNRWNYTDSNPVNYTDPTGHFPTLCEYYPTGALYEACVLAYYKLMPIDPSQIGSKITGHPGCYHGEIDYRAEGYLEGVSYFTGLEWGGKEIVYDFATMTRSTFTYDGPGLNDSFIGIGAALYDGAVAGLRSDHKIEKDYGGPFIVLQAGVSVSLPLIAEKFGPGAGIGAGGFISEEDPSIFGVTYYLGGTISIDLIIPFLDLGGAVLNYTPGGDTKYYASKETNTVDIVSLLTDLWTGAQSPWTDIKYYEIIEF